MSHVRAWMGIALGVVWLGACSDSDDGGTDPADAGGSQMTNDARPDAARMDAMPDVVALPDAGLADAMPDAVGLPDAVSRPDALTTPVVSLCEDYCLVEFDCGVLDEAGRDDCLAECPAFTGENARCQQLALQARSCVEEGECNDFLCDRNVLRAELVCFRTDTDICGCLDGCGNADRASACLLDGQDCTDSPSSCCTAALSACSPSTLVPCNCNGCELTSRDLCQIRGARCINEEGDDLQVCCSLAEAICIP